MTAPNRPHRFRPGRSPDALTLLLLHGTGGDEDDLLPLGQALDPGAALLSPRGLVREGGANRFFRRFAEGVLDLDDLALRADELADFVVDSVAHYGLDAARVVAVGFSNGANIAAATLLLRPDVLRGAALLAGMMGLEPPAPPDLSEKAVLLVNGRADPIVAPEDAERLARLLSEAGASVELVWHGGGHGITPHEVSLTARWLSRLGAATGSASLP